MGFFLLFLLSFSQNTSLSSLWDANGNEDPAAAVVVAAAAADVIKMRPWKQAAKY